MRLQNINNRPVVMNSKQQQTKSNQTSFGYRFKGLEDPNAVSEMKFAIQHSVFDMFAPAVEGGRNRLKEYDGECARLLEFFDKVKVAFDLHNGNKDFHKGKMNLDLPLRVDVTELNGAPQLRFYTQLPITGTPAVKICTGKNIDTLPAELQIRVNELHVPIGA